VASQFQPVVRSRPDRPHPLFKGFVNAAIAQRDAIAPAREDATAAEPAHPASA
jgi:hypothetical protein